MMKRWFLITSLFFSQAVFAASPFTHSGSSIQAIFESELWKHVFGAVELIESKGSENGLEYFAVTTTEVRRAETPSGAMGSKQYKCVVVVGIKTTMSAPDASGGAKSVETYDFSDCPGRGNSLR